MLNICRDGAGFRVQMMRRGVKWRKHFSDLDYGSKEKALLHAKAWRDTKLRKLGPSNRGAGAKPLGTVRLIGMGRTNSDTWEATINYEGNNYRRKYSVRKYGHTVARRLAVDWLLRKRGELYS